MDTITDFSAWLDQADLDDHEEVYALYKAVEDVDDVGLYKCTASKDGTKWFVEASHTEDKLMLASVEARAAFLKKIENEYTNGELDIESWYYYQSQMNKDD